LDELVDYPLELQQEVGRLRDSAAQNSRNSSRPPSTDRPETPKPKSLRQKSGRPSGGQPGHPGHTLQPSEKPQHIQIHPLRECGCGEDLSQEPALDFERRQIFDLPTLVLECTEHRSEIKECPNCGRTSRAPFPADLNAPVQYGKNFRALLAYLYDAQAGASLRIRQMCQEMFGFAISEATLQKARQEQSAALEPFENRLRDILPQEKILHADETSVPINKVNHWLHTLCTPLLTFFSVQPTRGKEAIQAIGIIPRFVGWLMHDFLSSYLSFENCLHTFCKGHLLRELVFLFEQHQQPWAKDLYDLFLAMRLGVKDRKARDAGGPWRQQRDQDRRQSRITKAQAELKRLAAVQRKKVDPQKLASPVGRCLQRLKAHKYFTYQVEAGGRLQWERKEELIAQETQQDGWYLLHTNEPVERCATEQVLAHYKGLLDVEEAFCELKSYLEVRPVHPRRPDRVVNHVRLCFLAYWLSARLGGEWRAKGETEEVPRILRHLQTIRLGSLRMGKRVEHALMTQIPKNMNRQLQTLGLAPLFAAPPKS
jgi:transposase